MILSQSLLFTIIISAIAIKSLVDFCIFYFKNSLKSIKIGKIEEMSNGDLSDFEKISIWSLIVSFIIDLVELCGVAYLVVYSPFVIFGILLPIVLINFFITWLVILFIRMYIIKNGMTRLIWAYFSIKLGFLKDVICILLFLVYITKCIVK